MLFFYFLLALENDLGEVETSWPFIVNFYYKVYFKEISYQKTNLHHNRIILSTHVRW